MRIRLELLCSVVRPKGIEHGLATNRNEIGSPLAHNGLCLNTVKNQPHRHGGHATTVFNTVCKGYLITWAACLIGKRRRQTHTTRRAIHNVHARFMKL
jgi:hypothetical protein